MSGILSRAESVSDLLAETAARVGQRPAILAGRKSMTFRQLDDDSAILAAGLIRAGVGPGMRAALLAPPGMDFAALTFALFRAGAVPVLIDPGIGWKNMGRCLAQAEPQAFIGSEKAHLARLAGGWARGSLRIRVTAGRPWFWGGLTLQDLRRLGRESPAAMPRPRPDDAAAILFTSGSTGAPKGAVYTHSIFCHQARMLAERFGITPGDYSIPTFPLFALFDVALGLSAVIPRMDPTRPARVDPLEIVRPVQKYGAVQLFGSPALLDAVGRFGERHGVMLPSLKRVICAGAPVPARVLERMVRMLRPGAEVHTPYGATEALPLAHVSSSELLRDGAALTAQGRGVCVGRTWPGMEARIIRIDDSAISSWSADLELPRGCIGEITAKGPVVTREYFRDPNATALAKIPEPDGSVRHRMGDLGYIDEKDRLWFCGRKSQRVITSVETLFTIPCEGVFNSHPQVRRSALVGVQIPGGQVPVLCVELEPGAADVSSIRAELLELGARFAHTRRIRTILFHPAFPVDIRHNAKIFREKLAVWAKQRIS